MKRLPERLLSRLAATTDNNITPLPGNENENFLVRTGERSFVVKRLRGHSAANTELEGVYRHYLAKSGFPVAPYIRLNGASYVLALDTDTYVATSYKEGKMATPTKELATETAAMLARIHSLNASSMPKRQSWYRQNYVADALGLVDNKYSEAKKAFAAQLASIADFWQDDLPKGIIHGDLQEENILISPKGKIASILDWEETAVEPLLLDVAHTAQQITFIKGTCDLELFKAFMHAYQGVRPLTALEKKLFGPALQYTMLVLSTWAHIKVSRGEMGDQLFQRIGNYYKSDYPTPKL